MELTPDTSYGYDLIDFAADIGWPLDPWQQWLAIHMGELLPDGRPRFRVVLALVARQNGKTLLCRVLTLYWMFIETVPLIIGTSTSRDTAKVSWREVIEMAESIDTLKAELPTPCTRETIGEEAFFNIHGSRYRFAAPNRRAGRSLTVHRLILDELREHRDWDTYNAAVKAMTAVADAQAVAITNQGDAGSVVLDSLRESALEYIETGVGDPRLGLFEWSAPSGSDSTDPHAIAHANPNLGDRVQLDSIIGDAMRAKRAGGLELAGYKTETLCMRVTNLDSAIDEDAWRDCGTDTPVDLAAHRQRVALCLDVALDSSHATLAAAATIDGVTHVEVVRVWQGHGCTQALRHDLPGLVDRIRPRTVGWFPAGPAAAVAASVRSKTGSRSWAPRRTQVAELTAEVTAVCMGLAEQVQSREIRHPRDDMLTAHVEQTQKLKRGDAWTFTRRGSAPIDAAYALAGAVHLARTLPAAPPPLTVA
ncbi:terminase large subunit [Micromonospora sp. WMMA1363]|uniref:terminase large subunit n=1 Tax=Micromonospora sp. WMMA1363 TaxID=3053985 RepID=UPI00259D2486|nr:terminase large subunit [Micromonospora sp. WMMA1363]MDM4721146.1 terminase large subunit [Micromonospora sp. WMMA1363]